MTAAAHMADQGFVLVSDDTQSQVVSGATAPVYSLFLDHGAAPPIISTSERDKQRLVDIDIIRSSLLNHVDVYDPTMYTLCEKYAKLHRELHNVLKDSYRESQEASLTQLHWRDRWNVILSQPHCCKTGRYIAAFTSFLIFLTAVQFALETVPILSTTFNSEMEALWITVELVVTVFFTIEILVRFLLERDRAKWLKTPMNICDIVSVAPFFLLLAAGQNRVTFIKLIRLVRFLKLFRNFKQIDLLVKTLSRVGPSLLTPFLFLSICVLLIAAALYNVEGGKFKPPPAGYIESLEAYWSNRTNLAGQTGTDAARVALAESPYNKFWMEDCFCTSTAAHIIGDRQCPEVQPRFGSGLHTMWFAIVTMTTVGYGDFVPTCFIGKAIAIIGMLMSSVFLAMPIAIVGVSFTQSVGEMNQTDRSRKIAMTHNIASLRRAAAAAARQRMKKRREREKTRAEAEERMKRLHQMQSGADQTALEDALLSSFAGGGGGGGPHPSGGGLGGAASGLGGVGLGELVDAGVTGAAAASGKSAAEARLEAISKALEQEDQNEPMISLDGANQNVRFRIARAEGLVRYQPRSVAEGLLMQLGANLRVPRLDFTELCSLEASPHTRLMYLTALHHADAYLRWILEGWLRQVCATTSAREPTIEGFNSNAHQQRRAHELQTADDREVQVAQDWEECVKTLRGVRAHETSGAWLPTLVLTSASLTSTEELDEDFGGIPPGVSPELTISRPAVFAIACYPDTSRATGGGGGGGGGGAGASGANNLSASQTAPRADGGMGHSVQHRFEHLPGIGSVPVVMNLGEVTTDITLPQLVAYLEVRRSMLMREIRLVPVHPTFHPIAVNDAIVPREGIEVKHDSIIDFAPFVGKKGQMAGDGTLKYQMKFDLPMELQ